MHSGDEELLRRMAGGDRNAFTVFYDRHAGRVYGMLGRMLSQKADADDVLQQVFWQVWTRASGYNPERSAPEVWLLLIARSRALDHLRRRRVSGQPEEVEPIHREDPATNLERRETAHQLQIALTQLPEEQRSAISHAFFQGLTHEEIAQRCRLPLGTVKTRIRLGMNRLRTLLTQP